MFRSSLLVALFFSRALVALTFDELISEVRSLRSQEGRVEVVYVASAGGEAVSKILFEQLRKLRGSIFVITSTTSSTTLRDVVAKTGNPNIRAFQVIRQGLKVTPVNGVEFLEYPPNRQSRVTDPYLPPDAEPIYTAGNFFSDRTDDSGRDLLAGLLFDLGLGSHPVRILDFGGISLPLIGELLARIKYERMGASGFSVKFFDLNRQNQSGLWGIQAINFMSQIDLVAEFMRGDGGNYNALEFITFDLQRYFEHRDSHGAWRLSPEAQHFSREELSGKELQEEALRLNVAAYVSAYSWQIIDAVTADMNRNLAPPSANQDVMTMPSEAGFRADMRSWLEYILLRGNMFQLIHLEKVLFAENSRSLVEFQREGKKPDWRTLHDSDPVFAEHLAQVGEMQARFDLESANRLNRIFRHYISYADANGPYAYWLRREAFGRGTYFGGRWDSMLSKCAILARLRPR